MLTANVSRPFRMALQLRDGTEHMTGSCGAQREQFSSPTRRTARTFARLVLKIQKFTYRCILT